VPAATGAWLPATDTELFFLPWDNAESSLLARAAMPAPVPAVALLPVTMEPYSAAA
jgi:hypothetical protein